MLIRKAENNRYYPSKNWREIIHYCNNIIHLIPFEILKQINEDIAKEEKNNRNLFKINYDIHSISRLRTKIKRNVQEIKRSAGKWENHLK